MKRYWKLGAPAATALLALVMFAPSASAQRFGVGFRGGWGAGPRYFGPSFYVGGGPYWGGWYGPGYYGLGWYEPYGFVPAREAGKVKVVTKVKDTQVYVDGGYAGTSGQLGSFPLKTGTHGIELRAPDGRTIYQEQINVLPGKTVDIKI